MSGLSVISKKLIFCNITGTNGNMNIKQLRFTTRSSLDAQITRDSAKQWYKMQYQ